MMSTQAATTDASVKRVAVPEAALTPEDLGELLDRFNDVTAKLQGSHEKLNREVHRLRAELRDANEQLERSRRLAALGEMAAGIAHEIRNPLGSIGLYARLLDDDLESLPESRETARKIGRAVHGLEAIVRDVLSFAGGMRIKPQVFSSGELFDASIEVVGPVLLASARVERSSAEIQIHADWGLLKQALVNLVRNAAEAMAENQTENRSIVLEAERMCDERTVIRVRDTGPGIEAEAIERMFNPFYTTRASGTGLGLAIVHRILDAHGGGVRASNNAPEPGATIELQLPTARAAENREQHERDIEQEQAA